MRPHGWRRVGLAISILQMGLAASGALMSSRVLGGCSVGLTCAQLWAYWQLRRSRRVEDAVARLRTGPFTQAVLRIPTSTPPYP